MQHARNGSVNQFIDEIFISTPLKNQPLLEKQLSATMHSRSAKLDRLKLLQQNLQQLKSDQSQLKKYLSVSRKQFQTYFSHLNYFHAQFPADEDHSTIAKQQLTIENLLQLNSEQQTEIIHLKFQLKQQDSPPKPAAASFPDDNLDLKQLYSALQSELHSKNQEYSKLLQQHHNCQRQIKELLQDIELLKNQRQKHLQDKQSEIDHLNHSFSLQKNEEITRHKLKMKKQMELDLQFIQQENQQKIDEITQKHQIEMQNLMKKLENDRRTQKIKQNQNELDEQLILLQEELNSKEFALQQINEKYKQLKSEHEDSRGYIAQIQKLQKQLDNKDKSYSKLQEELSGKEQEIKKLKRELQQQPMNKKIDGLEELKSQYEILQMEFKMMNLDGSCSSGDEIQTQKRTQSFFE